MEYKINFIRNSYIRFAEAHKDELINAFWDRVSKGELILRDEVRKFEDTLAKYTNTKYGIGVNSGTDALTLSVRALGIGPGDEVICPAHTFIASIYCIVANGATPILVDVGPNELIDPERIVSAITEKTKAILPVHFHGKTCDMDRIMLIAAKNKLFVIEDAAQALGSTYKGQPAGSFGDLGCFSFNTPKLLGGWGDGGGIVTNNKSLAEKLYLMRNHYNMAQSSIRREDFPTPEIVEWAGKSRLDEIQAALLNVKWKYFDQLLARRKEIADIYCKGLQGLPFKLPEYNEGDVIQEFIIRVLDSDTRESLKNYLAENGIEIMIRETTPNHKVKNLGLENFNLPITESISKDALRLPCYPELYNEEIEFIIQKIKDFYYKEQEIVIE